jgi:hypothetical protein
MHTYASDSIDRKVAPFVIAAFAVLAAVGCSHLLAVLAPSVPWWVKQPTVMMLYGFGHLLYDRLVWRCRIGGLRLSQIPDCGGTWYGEIHSSHNSGTKIEGMVHVHQTWSKICVEFESESSRSFSRMAALNVTPGATEGLVYEYTNEPRGDAVGTMHAHPGFAAHRMAPDGQTMEVDYYTGRGRETHGTMRLRRVCRERLSREEAARRYTAMRQTKEGVKTA